MGEFWTNYGLPTAIMIGQSLLLLSSVLIIIAYLLLADRRIWAAVQLRKGPNVVGPFGLLQSFADFLKFILKEPVIPAAADRPLFLLAPVVMAVLAMSAWAVIPVDDGWVVADINVGILFIFAISSLGVYGVIIGGWASNSKYPFLGALVGSSRVDLQACKLEYSIVSPK